MTDDVVFGEGDGRRQRDLAAEATPNTEED
jgi:hypothetical protein